MAKKPQSREGLLAQLEALDNSTEVATLKHEVADLTATVQTLTADRNDLAKRNRSLEAALRGVYQTLTPFKETLENPRGPLSRGHTYGAGGRDVTLREAAGTASRLAMAEVQSGIAKGTHDPRTGLPYTKETKPMRDLGSNTAPINKGEMAKLFPALNGPQVVASDSASESASEGDYPPSLTPVDGG